MEVISFYRGGIQRVLIQVLKWAEDLVRIGLHPVSMPVGYAQGGT